MVAAHLLTLAPCDGYLVKQVEIVNGPHKGKQGEIVSVIRDQNKVIVENINMVCVVLWISLSRNTLAWPFTVETLTRSSSVV